MPEIDSENKSKMMIAGDEAGCAADLVGNGGVLYLSQIQIEFKYDVYADAFRMTNQFPV